MNQNNLYILLIIATIVALMPVFLIKKYILTNNKNFIYLTIFFYMLLILSYIKIFTLGEISSLYTILQITQIIVVVIGGLILFGEKITKNKLIGLSASIIAIVYLLKK
jgi:multidrug transporter EmrE-like cation transporter